MSKRLGYEFDATYAVSANSSKPFSFGEHVESEIKGGRKIPVYVRSGVFDSDEHIIQTLSHEIFEIEDLRYSARVQMPYAQFRKMVGPREFGNLHYNAVLEGDANLRKFRAMREAGEI